MVDNPMLFNHDYYIPESEHPLETMELKDIASVLYKYPLEEFFRAKYKEQPLGRVVEELLTDLLCAFDGVDIIGLLVKKQEEGE